MVLSGKNRISRFKYNNTKNSNKKKKKKKKKKKTKKKKIFPYTGMVK
jgi:hypothetical protein